MQISGEVFSSPLYFVPSSQFTTTGLFIASSINSLVTSIIAFVSASLFSNLPTAFGSVICLEIHHATAWRPDRTTDDLAGCNVPPCLEPSPVIDRSLVGANTRPPAPGGIPAPISDSPSSLHFCSYQLLECFSFIFDSSRDGTPSPVPHDTRDTDATYQPCDANPNDDPENYRPTSSPCNEPS